MLLNPIICLTLILVLVAQSSHAEQVFTAEPSDSGLWDSNRHVAGNCFVERDGKLHLLYYAATSQGSSAVGLAVEEDDQFVRRSVGPVLEPGSGTDWDAGGVSVFPGCVIQRKDGTYWLYYSGISQGSPDFYWKRSGAIGLAFSNDLVHWNKYANNPIFTANEDPWEKEGVFEPSIIFTGDEFGGADAFLMYYGGNNSTGNMKIGLATSPNGQNNWVRNDSNPILIPSDAGWDKYTIEVHHAFKLNGFYYLLYEGTDRKFPSRFAIGFACSKDGINFKKKQVLYSGGMTGSFDTMGAPDYSRISANSLALV